MNPTKDDRKYILLPRQGTAFAVLGNGSSLELHGGFTTHELATKYAEDLEAEYSGYTSIDVIEIELEGA